MDKEHPRSWIQDVHLPVRWCCEECDEDGKSEWFDDEEAIENHIERQHPESREGPELDAWKEMCKATAPRPPYACPVCSTIPKKLADIIQPDDDGKPARVVQDNERLRDELFQHMAQHLKEVGLMSTHYLYDPVDDSESGSITARLKIGAAACPMACGKTENWTHPWKFTSMRSTTSTSHQKS